jgi:hypothetical protein
LSICFAALSEASTVLQLIDVTAVFLRCVPWLLNPYPFPLQTDCSQSCVAVSSALACLSLFTGASAEHYAVLAVHAGAHVLAFELLHRSL